MTNAAVAEVIIRSLGLSSPPIGLSLADSPPESVAGPSRVVPAACSFWRLAEQGVFYAPARAHDNCPIGTMVMGFSLTDEIQQALGELMGSMCGSGYFGAAEADKVPTMQPSAAGILYGPLADLPVSPTVVLFWLTPGQAMIYNEAAGSASWAAGPPLLTGRPACAALPAALAQNRPALSFGCSGMRTFTEIPDDRMLAAVPGDRVAEFADELSRIVDANKVMGDYYHERKAAIG